MTSRRLVMALVLAAGLVSACGGGGSGGGSSPTAGLNIDDKLQGKIEGRAWTVVSAQANPPSDPTRDSRWSYSLYPKAPTADCELLPDRFSVDSAIFSFPMQVIKKSLTDILQTNPQTLTLVGQRNGSAMNNIASNGSIEITNITAPEAVMKIDAWLDGNNYIKGTVTVKRCCPKAAGFGYEPCTTM